MSALPKVRYSPEEYLEIEEKSECKNQYVDGEIFAMAGAEPWHNEVAINIAGFLWSQLRGRQYKVYLSNMRVRVEAAGLYTYPDVTALCGKPIFETADKPRSLLNPQVIFEISSPSTESFDRGDKFRRYRRLESLVDYVLVSPEKMRVELFTRQAHGDWLYREYQEPTDRLHLASVGCELPLSEIYNQVDFPSEEDL